MRGVVTSKPPGKKTPAKFTHDEIVYTARAMDAYGGSFAYHIAKALEVADSSNRATLIDAFPDLMSKFGPGSDFYKAVVEVA